MYDVGKRPKDIEFPGKVEILLELPPFTIISQNFICLRRGSLTTTRL